jgi:hypothetical protein
MGLVNHVQMERRAYKWNMPHPQILVYLTLLYALKTFCQRVLTNAERLNGASNGAAAVFWTGICRSVAAFENLGPGRGKQLPDALNPIEVFRLHQH